MGVRDSLIGLLAPAIGEARAIHLLNDFVVSATVGSRTSRKEHRDEVLAEAQARLNETYQFAPLAERADGVNFAIGVLMAMRGESRG